MLLWSLFFVISLSSATMSSDNIEKAQDDGEAVFKKLQEKEANKRFQFPPCQACKKMIESFKKGMDKTSGKTYDGGNTQWEEENLPKYSKSHLRLVEILEKVCTDLDKGSEQCHSLVEETETEIEKWWFELQDTKDIYEYICIESLKHCCPQNHYGPECKPCPGYPDFVCSNNGKCKGNGTRKGNGGCACNDGYSGKYCEECAEGFYSAYRDENSLVCSPCHPACLGACSQAGPKACSGCKSGYVLDLNHGCIDINECHELEESPCKLNEFCINTEGSYTCLDCDRSCRSCDGDGPDMCHDCAPGYILKDNMCVEERQHSRDRQVTTLRYLVYLGLTVATCIIFQNNHKVAYGIGLAVALYIAASERIISQSNTNPNAAMFP